MKKVNVKLIEDIEKERRLEKVRKDFIAGVSHELKTPFSMIQVVTAMLQDGIAPEQNDSYLQAIDNEVEKMNILVEEMLNLAKFEFGTYQIRMEQVDISEIINRIHKQLQLSNKSLDVVVNLEACLVKGKEHLLEQVIINLFTNAIRYTEPKKSIIIDVKSKKNRIYVGIENKGAYLPEENLDKV
ncbi:hypothetical protein BK708_05840 [Bacillus thuringiensis serovar yunnanensis]|nr:hypothetical protein BK708_05840 [Bacillus thuringiensis serovar yunnanensis]